MADSLQTNPEYDTYQQEIESLIRELSVVKSEIVSNTCVLHDDVIHANYKESAKNLIHYLALRCQDRRPLQMRLASMGLSSLGRLESHVLTTIDAVLRILQQLQQNPHPLVNNAEKVDFIKGQKLLDEHTEAVLGKCPDGRTVRIMVTMPTEAAHDYALVRDLVSAGMDCMRINCAHDDVLHWENMVKHLRLAEKETGRSCRVVMDVAGPKLRTGPVEPGPKVMKIRPVRDAFGRVVMPARVFLTGENEPDSPSFHFDYRLPVSRRWLSKLKKGDQISFTDAREASRMFTVIEVSEEGCLAESPKTAYLVPGTQLHLKKYHGETAKTVVGDLPATINTIPLHEGDLLVLKKDGLPGKSAVYADDGRLIEPATIGCTIPEALDRVKAGEPVWFDDGKIGGVIEKSEEDQVCVRITHTNIGGGKLAADKGLNFPGSELRIEALTSKDLEDLVFAAEHADVVELSFANTSEDVFLLQKHLQKLGGRHPSIVLKVETQRGFNNLPGMLLAAMQWPACGVMIARGDLAVECGFERMAEIQEEILWICEAAHVPVIWATQVLETLAKQGMPSRAEITDAAMSDRAECVMLNKGPYVVNAVKALDDILRRMQQHQAKKCAMLRELHLAHNMQMPQLVS